VATEDLFKHSVILAGIAVVGMPMVLYFLKGVSFEKVFVLMVLTLPLTYGFAINIGGTVRLSYLFAVLALFVGLQQRKLKKFPKELAIHLLLAFLIYAVASTAFTFRIDFSSSIESEGFRLTPFRTIIQAGQLILMILVFYLTLNYLDSLERLRRFYNLVFWSTAAVTLYGIYDFVAALFGLQFFSVIYDTSYYAGGAADNPFVSIGSITIPRPRSTLGEPLNLSIFLLFAIPFSIVAIRSGRKGPIRWLKTGIVVLESLLFFTANSRASLGALFIVSILLFWLVGSHVARVRLLLTGVAMYLLVAFLLLPMAGGQRSITGPFAFYQERLMSVSYLAAALEGDKTAVGQIGRNYRIPIGVFKQNPILGVGLGNYPFYYPKSGGRFILVTTFSLYLRLLTELGLIGTFVFLFFIGTIYALDIPKRIGEPAN